jgi:hypothetical protein
MQIIAIVSRSGPVLDAYRRFLERHDVSLIHALSISQLCQTLPDTSISGFMVEIQVAVKATDTEKDLLHTLERIFPNVKTNWNPTDGFRALHHGAGKSGEENLIAFVQDCRKFKPRALRKDKRHEEKCNVLFWPAGASEETAQRAYTLDISRGGLFVCTCDPPPEGSAVWVTLREVDARPFKVLVMWKLAWGVAMRIPGFGGSFVEVDGDLGERLEAFLAENAR